MKNHGMTVEEYDAMWAKQGGRCAICAVPLVRGGKGKADVDHSHQTGKRRGILCHLCNCVIGFARESIEVLERTISYLETFR